MHLTNRRSSNLSILAQSTNKHLRTPATCHPCISQQSFSSPPASPVMQPHASHESPKQQSEHELNLCNHMHLSQVSLHASPKQQSEHLLSSIPATVSTHKSPKQQSEHIMSSIPATVITCISQITEAISAHLQLNPWPSHASHKSPKQQSEQPLQLSPHASHKHKQQSEQRMSSIPVIVISKNTVAASI